MIRLRNSATGAIEPLALPESGPTTMYVCGPTVYGEPHVGNARPVIVFDVLYRLLLRLHPQVRYARNITDIDDKIIAAAAAAGVAPSEWALRCAEQFHAAIGQLGALEPDCEPKATEHIGDMADMIGRLIDSGHAYAAAGHVLFDVASYPAYGSLSHRSGEDMVAGARVQVADYKRNPQDFVLWKPAEPDQPGWPSPWGRGRPGWHIECSAMIRSCLGETIDIHGGGNDLLFPHHENESAQSCCATGAAALARFWVHNGQVTSGGRKMAKSEGNFATLTDALARYPADAVRYALLSAHYRSPLEWGSSILDQAAAAVGKLYRSLDAAGWDRAGAPADAEVPAEMIAALCDDLNTPQALAHLHDLAAQANRASGSARARAAQRLAAAAGLVGLLQQRPSAWMHASAGNGLSDAEIESRLAERAAARSSRDFAAADRLRDELADAGVVIEDGAAGTGWRRR